VFLISFLYLAGIGSSRISPTILMVACWHLWTWRNKSIFEEGFQRPHDPTFTTLKVRREIEGCFDALESNRKCDMIYIVWK
jgi:hypothetical protein